MTAHPFHGTVVNGKPLLDAQAGFMRMCAALEGKRITVTIQKYRKPRSTPQNSYLWAVPYALIGEHIKRDVKQVHELMKYKFLMVVDPGSELPRWRSTTDLSTVEFNAYLDEVIRWGAEMGVYIPLPNEVEMLANMEMHQ